MVAGTSEVGFGSAGGINDDVDSFSEFPGRERGSSEGRDLNERRVDVEVDGVDKVFDMEKAKSAEDIDDEEVEVDKVAVEEGSFGVGFGGMFAGARFDTRNGLFGASKEGRILSTSFNLILPSVTNSLIMGLRVSSLKSWFIKSKAQNMEILLLM